MTLKRKIFAPIILYGLYKVAILMFDLHKTQTYHDMLVKQNNSLRQDNVRLNSLVHALKSNPDYIEQLARDKLGLARPGEIVYYYDKP